MDRRPFEATDRIETVTLDPLTITTIDPDVAHEWRVAIYDLVEKNRLYPARVSVPGPYALHLSIIGNYILLDIRNPESFTPIAAHYLSLSPFRGLIRDYFRIRESYFEAIRSAQPNQIEAVDMGRRGLHNEAADLLRTRLTGKLEMDHETARYLFTLICAVQPYASRVDERESGLPTVLFVCSMNSVRSPIAAALTRKIFPGRLIARSAGVRSGQADGFVHEVMQEIGVDMSVHTPHTLDELAATRFDLVITLSDDAQQTVDKRKMEVGRREHWSTADPTIVEGSRKTCLAAYRDLRTTLEEKITSGLESLVTGGSQSA